MLVGLRGLIGELDINCVSGQSCLALAQQGYAVPGVDAAEKPIT